MRDEREHRSARGQGPERAQTIPPRRWARSRISLRLRILVLVLMVVLATIVSMALFALNRFEEASLLHLQHEALMLSDVLEAAIAPALRGAADTGALQALIDDIGEARERNDIEINIMLLEGHRSSIVASNIPDNIETNSVYEHRDLLAALERNEPITFIGRDDDSISEGPVPATSPDHFIRPGERFISITTPLFADGQGVGSINTKLSLSDLDREIARIRRGILLLGAVLPVAALLLFLWAIQRGLRPLHRLAGEIGQVGAAQLDHRFSDAGVPTELQPIVTRLNELLERIDAAFHRERRFTSNAAHELRTPLAALKTLAEVGLQGIPSAPRSDDLIPFFEDTLAIAKQMEQLVISLLGLVRCEAGLEVDVQPVDVRAAIEEVWESHRDGAEERGLTADIELNGSATVETDRALMIAILGNLFSNAVAHAESGGALRCTLERNRDHVQIALANLNDSLTEDDLPHLFEPFWRKEEARSESTHCGLGLSLVAAYSRILSIEVRAALPESGLFEISLKVPTCWPTGSR